MAMTISQMANRAAMRGIKRVAFTERVRYWTREGLLEPVGELNPGTGRHRRYADSALEDALILNTLADFGIPIAIQRKALIQARVARLDWKSAPSDGRSLFLEIAMLPNGILAPHFHKSPTFMMAEVADAALILNLTKIFSAVKETASVKY
jgi:DNA-binding transcriptional MerR regulator